MRKLLATWVLLLILQNAVAQEYHGNVVAISDGDTFSLLTGDKRQIKVRLSEIDTSEQAQPLCVKVPDTYLFRC